MRTEFRIFQVKNDGLVPLPASSRILFSFSTPSKAVDHFNLYYSDFIGEVVILPVMRHTNQSVTKDNTVVTPVCEAVKFADWLKNFELLEKKNGQWVLESQISSEKLYETFKSKQNDNYN